ncbi:hypothetical protein UFOVP348_13 [uncultured Caudovirales phage]|uniref:Uncharacterized protein n=1 Tax=uncultured Caudovirales phage TaxID=2100421 RepID=A0A6J5LW60_9CAUD|nr:hypothetical protein UFOVP348_13 [uncultured Caudovirales phage]
MKTCLFIEDTPAGLKTKFVWQASGHMDHPAESIAMNVMANLTLFIRDMEKRKLLRLVKEGPGDNPPPVTAS